MCREIKNHKLVQERSETYLDDNKYIIFLENLDLLSLLKFKHLGLDAELNDFIDDKFRSLLFRS